MPQPTAAASGLCLGGVEQGRREGKRGEREGGNSGLDRHRKLHPVVGGRCGPHAQLDGACFHSGSIRRREFRACDISYVIAIG